MVSSMGVGALTNALVVTGGSSGIGAALTVEAAARGYEVVFGGSRGADSLESSLRKLPACYVQVDVRQRDSIDRFRNEALNHVSAASRLLVVASAGISARNNAEDILNMRRINVDGTANLLAAFMETMKRREGSRFVGVGSIVAAEGKAVKGDEAYQETKTEIQRIVTEDLAQHSLQGFTLIPGAIDTAMTRKEMVFPMLLLGALSQPDSVLYARLLDLIWSDKAALSEVDPASIPPAEVLRVLLGGFLIAVPNYGKIDEILKKYPRLGRAGAVFLKYAGEDPGVVKRAAEILRFLDVVVGPEVVARAVLDQFESGQIPERGMLKVYSRDGADPILGLLNSFG